MKKKHYRRICMVSWRCSQKGKRFGRLCIRIWVISMCHDELAGRQGQTVTSKVHICGQSYQSAFGYSSLTFEIWPSKSGWFCSKIPISDRNYGLLLSKSQKCNWKMTSKNLALVVRPRCRSALCPTWCTHKQGWFKIWNPIIDRRNPHFGLLNTTAW